MKKELEELWIKQLNNGSESAFSILYKKYVDLLYGFVFRLTKSSDIAQDIVQESFMRIWEKREHINASGSFKSYLFQIAYRLTIDHFREKIDSVSEDYFLQNELKSESYNEAESQLNLKDYHEIIERTLNTLPQKQRLIYQYSRELGLSTREISEKMQLSEKTVNNQISIIKSILKSKLFNILLILLFLCGR